jgi:site-specific recombinase XerD
VRPKEVWAIRVRLQIEHRTRDLAMFNLAIDSKLRGCDLVNLRVDDIAVSGLARDRATASRNRPAPRCKTGRTRDQRIEAPVSSRVHNRPHVSARQYAHVVRGWIESAGMDSSAFGIHSTRGAKAAQIYRKTRNRRAVQLLIEYTKIESTVRHLAIESTMP